MRTSAWPTPTFYNLKKRIVNLCGGAPLLASPYTVLMRVETMCDVTLQELETWQSDVTCYPHLSSFQIICLLAVNSPLTTIYCLYLLFKKKEIIIIKKNYHHPGSIRLPLALNDKHTYIPWFPLYSSATSNNVKALSFFLEKLRRRSHSVCWQWIFICLHAFFFPEEFTTRWLCQGGVFLVAR